MAKIREIIERCDRVRLNDIDDAEKVRWLGELDGEIALNIMLMSVADAESFRYDPMEDMDTELLVRFPYDALYQHYLEAKVDYANNDLNRYNASSAMYNLKLDEFRHWFVSRYEPGSYEEDCTEDEAWA